MNSEEKNESVWQKYVEAKQTAFGSAKTEAKEPLSMEELEDAIAAMAASSGIAETGMPPRSIVHPTERKPLSRWFYLTLLALFMTLVVGLLWWGRNNSTT